MARQTTEKSSRMNQPQHHQSSKNPVNQHPGERCSLVGEVRLTCVLPLDVGGAGAADAEARERKSLVSVHIEKVPGHGELRRI